MAFQSALQYYLMMENKQTHEPKKKQKKNKTITVTESENKLNTILQGDFDWSLTKIPTLESLGQYLLILQIANNEFQINMLSPEEIKQILNEKFRINKTTNAIGMLLMEQLGNYVDRTKLGKGYYYKITSSGVSYLEKILQNMDK